MLKLKNKSVGLTLSFKKVNCSFNEPLTRPLYFLEELYVNNIISTRYE